MVDSLCPSDLKLLRSILHTGHAVETLRSSQGVLELKRLVSQAAGAKSTDLSRLAIHERDLTDEMSDKHLAAILVPFERLHGRALRDDEWLVSTLDRAPVERATAPLVVIADNLRSAFNVGAILRTAEAIGAERAILTGYTPTPAEAKTARTSMGTDLLLPWEATASIDGAIARAREEGFSIVALETAETAEDVNSFSWPERCALIVGNERFGLEATVLSQADHVIRIPMYGAKNSLNVGIAFGIAANAWRSSRPSQKRADFALEAIGRLRANAKNPYEAFRQGAIDPTEDVGVIELSPDRHFEQALSGLDGFERIWLLYGFHRNTNWKPMVMPPRGPRVKRGVFATRSPHRPNALGLSCVELLKVEGRTLFVRGYDLLDETPIFDIKPYLPYADAFPSSRMGWAKDLEKAAFEVRFDDEADRQVAWLEANGVPRLRAFLISQLSYEPLDGERKRVACLGDRYRLSYRTWRADFVVQERLVVIQRIYSGYSPDEFGTSADPYLDKRIHSRFARSFSTNGTSAPANS